MPILEKDIKLLWGRAAGMCSYPSCRVDLVPFINTSEAFSIGEMAHVIAKSPKGRRGEASGGSDSYENLILLCSTHHTLIDKSPEGTFSVETILDWKAQHERHIRASMFRQTFSNFDALKSFTSDLLVENELIWSTFGPESEVAKQDPLSNTSLLWTLRKLDTIIPNNRNLIESIEKNFHLLSPKQKRAFLSFKQHARSFEQNAYERIDFYPRFPIEFEQEFRNSKFNSWEVGYPIILFLERALSTHRMVQHFERTDDILFKVQRRRSMTTVYILCLDEYALGLASLHEALAEFSECNCISVGGNWNGYTPQAKEFCLKNSIGLFTTSELLGGLWHQDFWNYHQKDEKGNPQYSYKVA